MITDPVVIFYDSRREKYRLLQGRETFYDEERGMREWDNERDAVTWCVEHLYEIPVALST